jgi:hypothetical protein
MTGIDRSGQDVRGVCRRVALVHAPRAARRGMTFQPPGGSTGQKVRKNLRLGGLSRILHDRGYAPGRDGFEVRLLWQSPPVVLLRWSQETAD